MNRPTGAPGPPSLRGNLAKATRWRLIRLLDDVRVLEGRLEAGDPTPDLAEIHLNYRAGTAALLNALAIIEGEDRIADLLA